MSQLLPSTASPELSLTVTISRRPFWYTLTAFAIVLTLAGWLRLLILDATDFNYHTLKGTLTLFDPGAEANVPAAYSAFLLLTGAFLLVVYGGNKRRRKEPFALTWQMVGLLVAALALDELAQIHEWSANVARPLVERAGLGDVFAYAWLAPAVLFLGACAVCFGRWFLSLSAGIRFHLLIAAGIFLSGAVGFEFLESWHDRRHGHDLTYFMMVNVEEMLEMAGSLYLIRTMLDLLTVQAADRVPTGLNAGALSGKSAA